MEQRRFVSGVRWVMVLLTAGAASGCLGSFGDKEDSAFPLDGTVTGLSGAVVLQNGSDAVTVAADGAFTFGNNVRRGDAYSVTVRTQPSGQTCTVANGSGTMDTPVTDVAVTCTSGPAFTIGGTVTRLSGTLVLRNGSDVLAIGANGAFTFANRLLSGQTYAVSVETQPAGQTCTVANGSGTVGDANVTNVAVTCGSFVVSYSIGGTLSGLTGTLVLRNNSESLSVSTNGVFTFANRVPAGQTYSVTVQSQPAGQACTVANGSGTVDNANVTSVAVTCTTNIVSYSIGGTVSGLTGGTLQLRLTHGSASSTINVTSNGSYDFDPDKVPAGESYGVTVATQPVGQQCSVSNGAGTATGTVTNVNVECAAGTFSVGGTVSGLTGSGLRIEENGTSNSVSPSPGATSFTLPDDFADGAEYDVGIAAQPSGQTCVITHSQGQVDAQDVADLAVACVASTIDSLAGTYAIPLPDRLVYLTFFADGVYVSGSVERDDKCVNNGNGVEYGVYAYDRATGNFAIRNAVVDTNGSCGVWSNGSRFDGTLAVSGTGQGTVLTLTTGRGQFGLVPVDTSTGQIYGSFADHYHRNFWLFTDAGGGDLYFFITETQGGTGAASDQHAGVEYACGSITGTPSVGTLAPDFTGHCKLPSRDHDNAVDTNGTSGLSNLTGPWNFNVSTDTLSSSTFDGTRITPN